MAFASHRTFQRSFHGSVEQLNKIRQFVVKSVRELGGSQDDIDACELAADEAATNCFEHGYGGRRGKIEIQVWREGNDLYIQVRDWGKAFDPDQIPPPTLDVPIEERAIGGLGLYLIRQVMDDVSFEFDKRKGNLMQMRRQLRVAKNV